MATDEIEIYQMTADRIKQTAERADPDHPVRLFDRLMQVWSEANGRGQVVYVRVGYHWLQWAYVDNLLLDDRNAMRAIKDHEMWRRGSVGGGNHGHVA